MSYALRKDRSPVVALTPTATEKPPTGNQSRVHVPADRSTRSALPPTSSFLRNRYNFLRKTEDAGAKKPATDSGVAPAPMSEVNPVYSSTDRVHADADSSNISTLNVTINPKFDEPADTERTPTATRPELPPKPVLTEIQRPAEPASPSESPTKKGRGILRVASLRGIRSRTPSPKKKEEFLQESVMYTKLKPAPPEPPLSGNRQHLLRRRTPENVTRVEVSAPQLVSSTATGATTIQIGGARAPSPAPQKTTVIPSPVHVQHPVSKVNVIVEPPPGTPDIPPMKVIPSPVQPFPDAKPEPTITPVYSQLSQARAMLKSTTTTKSEHFSSAASTSSFIQPNIRPIPPRKPLRRNEITETLMEVLPQKTQAPGQNIPIELHKEAGGVSGSRKHTSININRISSNLTPAAPVAREMPVNIRREEEVMTPTYEGHMNFDDDIRSNFSSHMGYEPSSADETTEELVKKSLVKASHGHMRKSHSTTIGNIQEEPRASPIEETKPAPPSNFEPTSNQNTAVEKASHYKTTLATRGYKPAVAYTSPDESDSSRGGGRVGGGGGRVSYIASTRPSRLVERSQHHIATDIAPAPVPREPPVPATQDVTSAGRRKYAERRLVLRNFEDALQRKRQTSASSVDSGDSHEYDSLRDRAFEQRGNVGGNKNGYMGRLAAGTAYDRQKSSAVTRSRYEHWSSDDGASDSIGIPEPLPEYEYPNRIQGRTIQEEQQIRETVRLRSNSSSSSGSEHSPTRGYSDAHRERHHFSRHFEISPEELHTARSLIHHRLPPTYTEPPPPMVTQRHPSQSPARRPPHLPPPSPVHVGPVVHHSDGETRYYPEKPKKKLGIVRRLSELVRGERKFGKRNESPPTMVRNASSSSTEQMDRKIPEPVPAAGTLSVRRQSPVRRYQDQPLRQRAAPAPVSVERGESFLRPAPVAKNAGFRSSGNFSDATAASFAYMDQPAPPVYAFPDKLQKKQNLRHRSMSEHNLNQPPLDSQSTFQYEDPHPVKPSKSVESLTESVHKEKYHGPLIVTNRPYKTSTERVTKTNLIPYGKQDGFQRPVRNTARVRSPRSSIYDKVGSGHYSSTPVLASTNKPAGMYSRNAPPLKPPRSYGVDWTAPSTDRDSDLQSSVEERIRLPAERPLERSRAEIDLRAATDRSDLYSEPLSTTADEAVHRAQSPIHERFHGHVIQGKSEVEKLVPEVKRTGSTVQSVDMAARTRTRMAANDYANRRYQSAAAGVNQIPVEKPRRMIPRESRPIERDSAKHYTSSYRMEMQNPPPGPSGGVVAERSRFFSDLPGMRKEYAVRR